MISQQDKTWIITIAVSLAIVYCIQDRIKLPALVNYFFLPMSLMFIIYMLLEKNYKLFEGFEQEEEEAEQEAEEEGEEAEEEEAEQEAEEEEAIEGYSNMKLYDTNVSCDTCMAYDNKKPEFFTNFNNDSNKLVTAAELQYKIAMDMH